MTNDELEYVKGHSLTKAERVMLEKLFAAEIEGALSKKRIRLFQTKSTKTIQSLRDKGMVNEVGERLGGSIRRWELTSFGHFYYCMTC